MGIFNRLLDILPGTLQFGEKSSSSLHEQIRSAQQRGSEFRSVFSGEDGGGWSSGGSSIGNE